MKGTLTTSKNFAGKRLCQSLFFNKAAGFSLQLHKKKLWRRCVLVNFVQFLKMTFLQNTIPLNSHGFIVCHTVSLSFSRSHGSFLISHSFTNFEQSSCTNSQFFKKTNTGSTFQCFLRTRF